MQAGSRYFYFLSVRLGLGPVQNAMDLSLIFVIHDRNKSIKPRLGNLLVGWLVGWLVGVYVSGWWID